MFRVLGNKAIDLKRRDSEYAMEEERIRSSKVKNGIIAGGILLGFAAGVFHSLCNIVAKSR